jgi:hypothetical protein
MVGIALLGSRVWIPNKEFVRCMRIISRSRIMEGNSLCVVDSRALTWFEELTAGRIRLDPGRDQVGFICHGLSSGD